MINQEQEQQMQKYDPAMISRLKREIIQDIEARREYQEDFYDYQNQRGYGRGYNNPPPPPPRYRNQQPMEFDFDWWSEREEYDRQRNQAMLRNQLRNELMALDKMNRRVGQVSDPQVRQALVELLNEARQQGATIPELIQSLSNNNPGMLGSVLDRVTTPFRGVEKRSFGWGLGAAVLGLLLLPTLAKSVRGLTEKAMGGTMALSEKAQGMFEMAKEEFEDIVAEAQYNRMSNSIDDAIKGQPPAKK